MAGCIFRKYILSHKNCTECTTLLQRTGVQFDNQSDMVYTYIKAFTHHNNDFGGLCIPNVELMSLIIHCAHIFATHFMTMMHTSKICLKLVNAVIDTADVSWFTPFRCSFNIHTIVYSYIKMHIFMLSNFLINHLIYEQSRKKRNRKALMLEHL